ncbi:MAG: hypothetical protein CVU84_12985 [Firmicutes bacterium HGW-Firmicutes-1]|nr:MAG: hypothetical protein CVU84_12985 [Firmicutes bacterium HGW-Firmicutes-1]
MKIGRVVSFIIHQRGRLGNLGGNAELFRPIYLYGGVEVFFMFQEAQKVRQCKGYNTRTSAFIPYRISSA